VDQGRNNALAGVAKRLVHFSQRLIRKVKAGYCQLCADVTPGITKV
jgi:hypothetical protein